MKTFLKHIFAFFLPFIIILICYFVFDPFKVVKHYDNYRTLGTGPALNRAYVSTMTYDQQYKTYHYDSFIFGNSRSLYYLIDEWKKHLPDTSVCYHFSASGGSVNGLYYKVKYIDDCGEKLRNALFIVDYQLLSRMDIEGHLYSMPPILVGYRNFFSFHVDYIKNWFDYDFLRYWTENKITGAFTDPMKDYLVQRKNINEYDPITNEEQHLSVDSLIRAGSYYKEKKIKEFSGEQHPSVSPPVLTEEAKGRLQEIHDILVKQKTSYRIVISPLYDQIRLNPADEKVLSDIFGQGNIFNFSGVNKWTRDYHNYYETSHYRPNVAAEIMDSIYGVASK